MYKPIGWFKINRKLFENDLFADMAMRGAFITIIGKTNWQPNQTWFCKREMKSIPVAIGQLPCSQQKLAKEFGWGINKTRNYLELLEKNGIISIKAERSFTMITVCNYCKYQDISEISGTTTETITETIIDTQTETTTDHVIRKKEDKEIKEDKNLSIEDAKAPLSTEIVISNSNTSLAVKESKPKTTICNPRESITSEQYQKILEDPTLANNDLDYLREQVRAMADWSKASLKKKADWSATLRNWIRKSRQNGILPNGIEQKSKTKTFRELEDDWDKKQTEEFLRRTQNG